MFRSLNKILLLVLFMNISSLSLCDSLKNQHTFSFKSLLTALPPFFLKNVYLLKDYIRKDEFLEIRKNNGDLAAVDAIFQKALELTNGNTGFALLISTLSTFDHYSLSFKIKFLDLKIPISNETKLEFQKRWDNLPSHFLPDSPKYPYGDKDKLQHIFGSAFLIFAFESKSLGNNYSIFVEKFEDRYISDGSYDLRDLRANQIGQEFGFMLLKNQSAKPSEAINNHYKER